jgi:hypothetical protein
MLREKKAPFICMWSLGGSDRYWQAKNSEIYIDLYDNFDQYQPSKIISLLNGMLGSWVKEYDPTIQYGPDGQQFPNRTGRLVATQLVNTPGLSPLNNPAHQDLDAKDTFRDWLLAKKQGSNLGIVKLDFYQCRLQTGNNRTHNPNEQLHHRTRSSPIDRIYPLYRHNPPKNSRQPLYLLVLREGWGQLRDSRYVASM